MLILVIKLYIFVSMKKILILSLSIYLDRSISI